ncbi:hypothetical protein, variant 3 [Aphanomyces astaci]|nr:hypothetical protein, variant 2 [Aphanomyces astaci]XP_009830219.1 hypothetical protein, variant 3 [Aphanomyces astaci]ETV80294.1 hypothetical protein, variant 2 [Aphanomyces astaci]ETV80295.1 hypothetical protein, variant 3 [Aphanomyces astaci]|eukprot:XP_009830218.1 hypothetical protein, variant 2 [Aphanomyces astaci]
MQCATIKFPSMVPSSALRKLARRHLFSLMTELLSATHGGSNTNHSHHLVGSKGVAVAIGDNYWHPLDAQFETRLQKRRVSQVAYDSVVRHILPTPPLPADTSMVVTPEMRACFQEDHLDIIVDRFHLFDHAETGTIDHGEVFVYFHGLADALALGNVQPLVAQLKSVDKVTLPSILHVLLGQTKLDTAPSTPNLTNPMATSASPSSATDRVDDIETKETLLALSHDCPPDNWELDDIVHAPDYNNPSTKANTVIKRVTITNNTQTKKPKKPRAAALPRVVMVHTGMSEHSVKKFWEATVRDHGLAETWGLFQKGEKRMLTETHTRLKTEDSAKALLQLRVRSRLAEGFVVMEGKKYVADALAADKASKEKKAAAAASAKEKSQTWTPKILSLDKGSTVVRSSSLSNLPLYSPTNHQPLYHKAPYQLPPDWKDRTATHTDMSWVRESFCRAPVGHQHDIERHRPVHPTIRANLYLADMTRLGMLPRIHDKSPSR